MSYNLGEIFAVSLLPYVELVWGIAIAFFIGAAVLGCVIGGLKALKNVFSHKH